MDYWTLLFSAVLILYVQLDTTEGNQIVKLKKEMNKLNDKFLSLEEKIYDDEFDIQREIGALWRQINGTSENENSDDLKAGKDVMRMANFDTPLDEDVDKMIRRLNESNALLLKGFSNEKQGLRDRITKFENDMLTFRNRHEHELSSLRNSLHNLAVDINDTMTDRLNKMDAMLTQTAVNVQQGINNDFDTLNMSILEDFSGLKESIVQWKETNLRFFDNRVVNMEVKQNDALESLMNKANETLESLKSTSEDGQKKAMAAQEFAQTKARELETMAQTIQTVSDQCVMKSEYMNKLNSLYYELSCFSDGGKKAGNSCFKLSTYTATWVNAVDACSEKGGYLAEVVSEEIKRELAKFSIDSFWIGGSDTKNEGQWVWQNSGKSIVYEEVVYDEYYGYVYYSKHPYWIWNEPNGDLRENCIECYGAKDDKAGSWNDVDCGKKNHFVCEFKLKSI